MLTLIVVPLISLTKYPFVLQNQFHLPRSLSIMTGSGILGEKPGVSNWYRAYDSPFINANPGVQDTCWL